MKLEIGTLTPEQVEQGFPGIEVISQEDGGFALVFASQEALQEFEARLSSLAEGGTPKYKNILFALQSVDTWQSEDRMGWALRLDGLPTASDFVLDIELWPVGRPDERESMISSFDDWLGAAGARILDRIKRPDLIAYRLRVDEDTADKLLRHRDVRLADLPPKFGLELDIWQTDIQDIPEVPPPSEGAPTLAVLDSGILSSHPLLASAVGDAQGFVTPDRDANDEAGHGTHVAGIALYDDVDQCARTKRFVPELRLLSGRILDGKAEADDRFIENIIEEAVRHFHEEYGCRVFNLSYGDKNKPYKGGRVRGLAYVLDSLSRELNVLFVVPTGNFDEIATDNGAPNYPAYLLEDNARLLDPAPALNVLTVGSLARWDRTVRAWRRPDDYTDVPIARHNLPSPFTRCGPSVKGAVKPELVAYGGNQAYDPREQRLEERWLGELSTSKDAAEGRLLATRAGTSFAAPHVAHLAARLLIERADASQALLRALLVANAVVPMESDQLLQSNEDDIARLMGYGMVDPAHLFRSTEEHVTLIAEEAIEDKRSHFFEIPVPESFYSSGKRRRQLRVSLAHTPNVRTTRIDYKATRLQFRIVEAPTLDDAVAAFDKATKGKVDGIGEFLGQNRSAYKSTVREPGTVQACSWTIQTKRESRLFAVVTRNDQIWSKTSEEDERYALVIQLADRENEQARLYTQIRELLRQRAEARGRAQA